MDSKLARNQKEDASLATNTASANAADALETTALYRQVCEILEAARGRAARSVNSEMVRAYWQIGHAIVEGEQAGKERADYGTRLVESLAAQMKAERVKGFSKNNLWYMRQFYLAFPEKLHSLRGELSWTHYRLLLKVEKPAARGWYGTEAATQNWSTREIERQINSLFWERAALSTRKAEMPATTQRQPAPFRKPNKTQTKAPATRRPATPLMC